MANQRSLLISPATLVGDGTLTFQCGDSTLGIKRIKLEWLAKTRPRWFRPSAGPAGHAVQRHDPTGASVNGQLDADQRGGAGTDRYRHCAASPTRRVRIEQGVEFSVDLDKVPARPGWR